MKPYRSYIPSDTEAAETGSSPTSLSARLNLREVERLHPAIREVLRSCSFLNPIRIPYELLALPDAVDYPSPGGASHCWIVREALPVLARLSLVRLDPVERCVWLHPMTRDSVRAEMDATDRERHLALLLGTLDRAFPLVHLENWSQCERFLPHALALLRQSDARGSKSEAGERLRRKAFLYLSNRGRHNEALALGYNPPEDDLAFGC